MKINDYFIPIPGSDDTISLLELDLEKKSAKFLIIKYPSIEYPPFYIEVKEISKIKIGEKLDILDDYLTFIEKIGENYITLIVGRKVDEFTLVNGDTNILGYAKVNVNTLLPNHLILLDEPLVFKEPFPPLQLTITDYSLCFDFTESKVKLLYKNSLSREIDPFNPYENKERFIVYDGISKANWLAGNPENGIKFDANGSGEIDSSVDFAVYNDFYMSEVTPDSFSITPVTIIKVDMGKSFKLRGRRYCFTLFEGKKVKMLPATVRTLLPVCIKNEIKKEERERIQKQIHKENLDKIIEKRRWVNDEFNSNFGFKLLKDDTKAISEISNSCSSTIEDFSNRIGHMNILIDLMDRDKLIEKLRSENIQKRANKIKSIEALELFLNQFIGESNYDKRIIENLKKLKNLRRGPPFHPSDERFYDTVKSIGFRHPIDWRGLWDVCLDLYLKSLELLQETISKFKKIDKR